MNLFEIIHYPFMQRAIIGGLFVAIVASTLGVFVTLKKQSFVVDAISHASLAGIALALLLEQQPIIIALLFGIFFSVGITYFRYQGGIAFDAIIGIFFSMFFALGILLINLSRSYQPELMTYLFGSILAIGKQDLLYGGSIVVSVIAIVGYFYHDLLYATFDKEAAYVRGVRVVFLEYLVNILVSMAVIISVKTVGVILATALFIIPASTAKMLARNFKMMIPYSVLFGIIATIGGLIIAFYLNISPGATIVLVSGLIFTSIFLVRKK